MVHFSFWGLVSSSLKLRPKFILQKNHNRSRYDDIINPDNNMNTKKEQISQH